MKLPYDIILEVLEIQEAHDDLLGISSMSQTCQTLRDVAVQHLLSRQIVLRSARDVVSFSLFLRADGGRRSPLLRHSLAIETGTFSEDVASSLVQLLQGISHLDRLILRDADKLLASDVRLPRAFAAMTCLKHLDFFMSEDLGNPEPCVYMLTRMRSRLVTASLHPPVLIRRWHEGQISDGLADPISLLRRSANTLTELSGTWLHARRHRTVYPNVKRLRILLHTVPDITPYIVAYPNLSSLDVRCGAVMTGDSLQQMSWRNLEGQQLTGCWSKLESLEGRLQDLYVVALQCEVANLTVHASRRHQSCNLWVLADVLSRARPARLKLEVDSSSFIPESETDDSLQTTLQRSAASSYIRWFELRIITSPDTEMYQLFSRIVSTMHELPLTSFKIELDSNDRIVRLESFARERKVLLKSPAARCACSAGIGEKALNLQQMLPSLMSLVVKPLCRCNIQLDGGSLDETW